MQTLKMMAKLSSTPVVMRRSTVSSSYATDAYGDSISSGAGNDSIGAKQMSPSADTIDGGAGTDSLIITAANLADSDFTNLTGIGLDGSQLPSLSLVSQLVSSRSRNCHYQPE